MIQKFFAFFALLFFFSCAPSEKKSKEKPIVLVSIAPYEFFVKEIAQDLIEVHSIVPKGVNPHEWEPTPKELLLAQKSRLWFQIGEPFEKKLLSALKTNSPSITTQDLRDGVEMIGGGCSCHKKDELDRHIWLSPKLALIQTKKIAEALEKAFPEHSSAFQSNLRVVEKNLLQLDREIKADLSPLKNRSILVSHPAFAYFCKEYEIKQLSVEVEGKDPLPQDAEKILEKVIKESVKMGLSLPQYSDKGLNRIAKKANIQIKLIDPYSSNYPEMLKELTQLIKESYEN